MLGTVNLINRLVTFDRVAGRVGFLTTDCTKYEPLQLEPNRGATSASTPTRAPQHEILSTSTSTRAAPDASPIRTRH